MAEWKRDDADDLVVIAAGVPDALAVLDARGDVVGWDESAACAYLAACGLPCGADCQARDHISHF